LELKEFVSRTLTEIAEGVADGAVAAEKVGAIINPRGRTPQGSEAPRSIPVNIEFTVGLSITDGTQTKGGIGVVAGLFALGSQGTSNASMASTTHIKFSVPVILPSPVTRFPKKT
jgi:hypothetical protein